jgi:hypothetical protein
VSSFPVEPSPALHELDELIDRERPAAEALPVSITPASISLMLRHGSGPSADRLNSHAPDVHYPISRLHLRIGVLAPLLAEPVGSGCALGTDCWMK